MKYRLIVYGLLAIALVLTTKASLQDKLRAQREEISVVVVNAPSKEQRNPYQEEYEKLLYPTVRISAGYSTGTGVIIATTDKPPRNNRDFAAASQIAQIITAAHVVGDETTVNIELYNATVITGTVVITDTIKDIALIKAEISTDKICCASLAQKNYTPYIFTPIYTVGCSLGLNPRPSQGIISVVDPDHWEVTSPILPGNSGGPVFDARTYEVIGIAVWVKVYNGQLITTMAGVVPITEIYEFLEQNK